MILPIADPLLVEASASLQGLAALSIGIFSSHAKASSRYLTVKRGEKKKVGEMCDCVLFICRAL
jgi:hypothetical protein